MFCGLRTNFNLRFILQSFYQPINTPIYDTSAKVNRTADLLLSRLLLADLQRIGTTNAPCDDSRILLGRNARRRVV